MSLTSFPPSLTQKLIKVIVLISGASASLDPPTALRCAGDARVARRARDRLTARGGGATGRRALKSANLRLHDGELLTHLLHGGGFANVVVELVKFNAGGDSLSNALNALVDLVEAGGYVVKLGNKIARVDEGKACQVRQFLGQEVKSAKFDEVVADCSIERSVQGKARLNSLGGGHLAAIITTVKLSILCVLKGILDASHDLASGDTAILDVIDLVLNDLDGGMPFVRVLHADVVEALQGGVQVRALTAADARLSELGERRDRLASGSGASDSLAPGGGASGGIVIADGHGGSAGLDRVDVYVLSRGSRGSRFVRHV